MYKLVKKLNPFFIFLISVILILSCESEKPHNNSKIKPNKTFKYLNYNELIKNFPVKKELNKISRRFDKINITAKAEDHDFIVETDKVFQFEKDDIDIFTFKILKTDFSSKDFENYIVEVKPDSTIVEYKVEYKYIPNELEDPLFNIKVTNLTEQRTINCGWNKITILVEHACTVDGCWDPQYTTTSYESFYVYNDCEATSSGGAQTATISSNDNSTGQNTAGSGTTQTTVNTTGGVYGNGGLDGVGSIISTPLVPVKSPQQIKAEFQEQINDSLVDCWNNPANQSIVNDIVNYLSNNQSVEIGLEDIPNSNSNNQILTSTEFANLALANICDGGEVDFVNKVIIDPSFENNNCLKGVYTQLGSASTFKNYIKNFDGDFSVANLKFSVGVNSNYPTANAVTSGPDNYLIEIMFNPNNLNRPQLDIARTFIHEIIHAEIFRKLLSCASLPNLNTNNYTNLEWENYITNLQDNFPGLYDYYVRYLYNIPAGQQATSVQHQLMAQHYRDIIIQTLQQFDSSLTLEVYNALSWTGLMGEGDINPTTGLPPNPTKAWENLTQTERLQILSISNNFLTSEAPCQP